MEIKTTRCTNCRSEFTDADIEGITSCPGCGSTGSPMAISDDVQLSINWHELRILTIWATNWADRFCEEQERRAIQTICSLLQNQYPDKTPLTLFGELAQLPKQLEEIGVKVGPIEHTVTRPPLSVIKGGKDGS